MGINFLLNKNQELTKGEIRIVNELKKAYSDEKNDVYIYVQAKIGVKRSDFIIIDSLRGICILEVKDWAEDYIKSVDRRNVKLENRTVTNPIMQVTGYKNILLGSIFNNNFEIEEEDISLCICFTNIKDNKNEKLKNLFKDDINYLFEDQVKEININSLFNGNKVNYDKKMLDKIRVSLFPEIEIARAENQVEDIKALDFEQEEFAKKIPLGHYMVTGIPGSGKTVILLSRAIHLIKENPNWNILIVTYNKSLKNKLNEKLDFFADKFKDDVNMKDINIENISVKHFHGITYELTRGERKPYDVDTNKWFNELVVEKARKNVKPLYDAVLIDEYQDFRMSWIELCINLCNEFKDKNGKDFRNIFLAGDRLQSIYNEKAVSWKSIGINMQGRSKLLKTSYRSANTHISLALKFLQNSEALKKEVNEFYRDGSSDNEIKALNKGKINIINGKKYEIENIIRKLKEEGYENKDILILSKFENSCKNIINSMRVDIRNDMKYVKDLEASEDKIIVTTYHSSKGLEAKVVILTEIDKWIGETRDNIKRKIVYVGMTRASEKLYIFNDSEGEYLQEINKIISNN